ncbi:hypothetical protein [Maribellus mangrovi]|uniref:hypothetical protein n=1 Tax=Maribellus mangrovi TaxID=3133146 RepID=UPI0030EC56E2
MEIKNNILSKAILLIFALTLVTEIQAQDTTAIDKDNFPNPVFVQPDPPKPVKGWEMINQVGNKVLEGKYPGKILKFQFEGDAVGIAVLSGPESGIIEYSVDNYPWQKKDLYVNTRKVSDQGYFFTLETGLKAQKHTLQIRLSNEKNDKSAGKKCALTHFYFNNPE